MTRMLLKCPQTSREPVSSLIEAAKPHLEPRLTHRRRLSRCLGRILPLSVSAGGWRRFGGPPPASCGGWWDQIGDRTRRPNSIVYRCGCLRSGLNNTLLRSRPHNLRCRPRARLRRLSRPARLPSRVERHLPHLAHPVLRSPRDRDRLVDPRLQLIQRRNRPPRNHPVVGDISLRPLDTRQFTIGEGGKRDLWLDLRPPFPRTATRGAP